MLDSLFHDAAAEPVAKGVESMLQTRARTWSPIPSSAARPLAKSACLADSVTPSTEQPKRWCAITIEPPRPQPASTSVSSRPMSPRCPRRNSAWADSSRWSSVISFFSLSLSSGLPSEAVSTSPMP
ncbi:hypothetical protein ASD29_31930 [Streptomyces sp. Root1295]|nr:hypothetical protein ASD29_31930 [Streptomyces sp. Root1295]